MHRDDLPADVRWLLTHVTYSCSEPGYVRFRQDQLRRQVEGVADTYADGQELLRHGAVAQLAAEEAEMIDRALAVLFVVGRGVDANAVQPLLSHRNERVRKAARTCLFETRRRPCQGDRLVG